MERAILLFRGPLFFAVPTRQRQALKGLLHPAQIEKFVDPFQLPLPFAILNVAEDGRNINRQMLLLRN